MLHVMVNNQSNVDTNSMDGLGRRSPDPGGGAADLHRSEAPDFRRGAQIPRLSFDWEPSKPKDAVNNSKHQGLGQVSRLSM